MQKVVIRLSLIFVVAFATLSSPASAKRKYGMAGCGLGSIIMGANGGQVSAVTSNASSANQVFGITSGSSNCLRDDQLQAQIKQETFLAANLNSLQKEMAQGSGETILAFADVLGCPVTLQPAATKFLVRGYKTIFKAPGIEGIIDAAKAELSKDKNLNQQCLAVS